MVKVFRLALTWVAGLGLSVLFIWLVGAAFCDSPSLVGWSDELAQNIHVPGSRVQWRSEGRGETVFGRYGVPSIKDFSAQTGPRVYLWGDSFVEAFQVDDENKLAVQLDGALFGESGDRGVVAGFGYSGEMVADYYFRIRKTEAVCGPAVAHVIVVADFDDLLPDRSSADHAKFTAVPEMRFIEAPSQTVTLRNRVIALTRAYFYPAVRRAMDVKGLHFGLGPRHSEASNPPRVDERSVGKMQVAWKYALTMLRQATKGRIVIVYVPHCPRIEGRSISLIDPNASDVALFAAECRNANVTFLDATEAMVRFLNETGRFPRGFANSRPGEGHLNSDGHAVLARLVSQSLRSLGALHAD